MLCNETGHHILSLLESQWKLKQQHDQNFPVEGKPLYKTNTRIRRNKSIQKSKTVRVTIRDPKIITEFISLSVPPE